jgi:hypothetical protein
MTPLDGDEEGDLGSSTTHTPADSITSLSVNNLTPIMNALQSPSPPSMTVGPSLESDSTSRPRSGSLLRARSFPHQRVSSRDIGGGPESQPLEPAKVTQLRRWILTLAIVDFDLEVGPVISQTYPSVRMTAAERENMCGSLVFSAKDVCSLVFQCIFVLSRFFIIRNWLSVSFLSCEAVCRHYVSDLRRWISLWICVLSTEAGLRLAARLSPSKCF